MFPVLVKGLFDSTKNEKHSEMRFSQHALGYLTGDKLSRAQLEVRQQGVLPGRGGFVTDHEKCQKETKSKSVLYYTIFYILIYNLVDLG